MARLLSGLFALLAFCAAFAADVKDAPIPETTNVVGIVIFLVLFVGMCAGFLGYMWWRNRHGKEE